MINEEKVREIINDELNAFRLFNEPEKEKEADYSKRIENIEGKLRKIELELQGLVDSHKDLMNVVYADRKYIQKLLDTPILER